MRHIFSALLVLILSVPLFAQEPRVVPVPADKLACFVDNEEKFMNFPRPLLFIVPELCPALGAEMVALLAQNSGDESTTAEPVERILLTKPQIACLIAKIADYIPPDADENTAEDDPERTDADEGEGIIPITLDCP